MQDLVQDRTDRHSTQSGSSQPAPKRLGNYLVEAGLLSPDQINVILTDQQATGMRFGEIVVARGWLKEQTIEWIVEKVIAPERQSVCSQPQSIASVSAHTASAQPKETHSQFADRQPTFPTPPTAQSTATKPFARRDLPISKPLPSVNSVDNGVYWVG